MSRLQVVQDVAASGVVAVIRMKDPSKLKGVADALIAGGVTAMEVTMTVPGAVGLIEQLAKDLPAGLRLGAGTVLDAETARQVILAGATFIVAPTLDLRTIEMCHRYDVAAMPGCFTPTEILDAWDAGADIVKVFPATTLGPSYFVPNETIGISHGSSTSRGDSPGISSKRIARGEFFALCRFTHARIE